MEVEVEEIKKVIRRESKKNPKVMFDAFCLVFFDSVEKEYNEFIEGLESELSRKDKIEIIKGLLIKRSNFWVTSNEEEACNTALLILKAYYRLIKGRKKVKRVK